METYWNKKHIGQLLCADRQALEDLLLRFGPGIYTWMYYHVGADAQVATELTGLTFRRAVLNLPHFAAGQQTLFQWLRNQAEQARDEGLAIRQMRPQRPWAWSQLPPNILHALGQLRTETVPESIAGNPFVRELVQAALAEIDPGDCELMMYRYHNLDTPIHIAEQLSISVEEVNDRLYRCRHSFRRSFIQLISSVNLGFSESSASGGIEMLDTNLEKLLGAAEVYQPLNETQFDLIRSQMLEAADQLAQTRSVSKPFYQSPVFLSGTVVIVIAILVSSVYWLTSRPAASPPTAPPVAVTSSPPKEKEKESPKTVRRQDKLEEEKLRQIFELGQAGRLDALMEILKSGQFASRVAAAHFIGQLADPSAIPLLEQTELQWYPDGPDNNPFATAINDIIRRFPQAAPPPAAEVPLPETVKKSEPNKPAEKPVTPQAFISGIVSNSSGQPIAGAKLELLPNPLFSKIQTPPAIETTQTDPNGRYQFVNPYEGAVFVACKGPANSSIDCVRAAWCAKDTVRVINFGGKPFVTGTLTQQTVPFANQPLILSDTLDWATASFRVETVTNAQGNFSFPGVGPGTYCLLNRLSDQHLSRLAVFEVPPQSDFHLVLDMRPVNVTLDYPAEPNHTAPVKAVLSYEPGLSESLHQISATMLDDGTILFENIIPGAYFAQVQLDSGIRIQQETDISADLAEQVIFMNSPSQETVTLFGRLLNPSPVKLFLSNADRRIHIDLTAGQDGSYELGLVPADIYGLAAYINGQRIEFLRIDLQNQGETAFDIDPKELMQSLCPLYAAVTDSQGLFLSGAQVWLTGGDQLVVVRSTGRGAFLAAPPGSYTLSAAYPGYPSFEQTVELKPSELLAPPDSDNTIHIQLPSPSSMNTP